MFWRLISCQQSASNKSSLDRFVNALRQCLLTGTRDPLLLIWIEAQTSWGFVFVVQHCIARLSINTINASFYWLDMQELPSNLSSLGLVAFPTCDQSVGHRQREETVEKPQKVNAGKETFLENITLT